MLARNSLPFRATRWLVDGLLTVLYPTTCEECGTGVSPGTLLCANCMASIERADPSEIEAILQRLEDPALADIFALWHFEKGSTIRRLQHQLKYGNRPSIGNWFGRALGAAWRAKVAVVPDLVMPIPLHPTRLLERGYNQSTRICEGFAGATGSTLDARALIRVRATRSQTSLSRSRRQKNLSEVFRCEADLGGCRVLVVDDVLTTGATLNEAARTLLNAGALDVRAAAVGLAHT